MVVASVVASLCCIGGCQNDEQAETARTGDNVDQPAEHPAADSPKSPANVDHERAAEKTDTADSGSEPNDWSPDDLAVNVEPTIPAASPDKKILEDGVEIVKRFDDQTVHYRWLVRLYVNFDRAKPWDQQQPGSWVRHGVYEEYYPGGEQLLERGQYVLGVRDGLWTYWHESGAKAKEGQYHRGKLHGQWNFYREDGALLRTENYANHRPEGTWEYFAEDGTTRLREEQYVDGKLDGARRTWHPGGQLASEEQFRGGKRHGAVRLWDVDGKLISSSEYVDGRRVRAAPAG